MSKSKEQRDELIEFLLEQNWRLTNRIIAVSAKSNRKSRHIKSLVKGLDNAKLREYRVSSDASVTEKLYLEEMVKSGEARLELERAELRIYELSYENTTVVKDNKALFEQQEYLNSVITLKTEQLQEITSIETTKSKMSVEEIAVITAMFITGMILAAVLGVGFVLWM